MKMRRSADEVACLLREAARDLANGQKISDIFKKTDVTETTYYRWRQKHNPAQVDMDRRCRHWEGEIERPKRIIAELMLDKQMLQEVAKKKW